MDLFKFSYERKHFFQHFRFHHPSDSCISGVFRHKPRLWCVPSLHPQARSLSGIYTSGFSDIIFHISQISVFFWKTDMADNMHPHAYSWWNTAAVCSWKVWFVNRFTAGHEWLYLWNTVSVDAQKTAFSFYPKEKGRKSPWLIIYSSSSIACFLLAKPEAIIPAIAFSG